MVYEKRAAAYLDYGANRTPDLSRARYRSKRRRKKKIRTFFLFLLLTLALGIVIWWVRGATDSPGPPSDVFESKIAEIAAGELGNSWEKYCSWWGLEGRDEWCAIFVCWAADQAGYTADEDYLFSVGVNADVGHPRDNGSGAGSHARFHNKTGRYQTRESGYVPSSGDLIYFDWNVDNGSEGDLVMDHLGIVERVWWGRVYTIEGNSQDGVGSADLVRRKSYALTDPQIRGYSDLSGITQVLSDGT